jgi:tetratricopeptide (TPR) repeat protein
MVWSFHVCATIKRIDVSATAKSVARPAPRLGPRRKAGVEPLCPNLLSLIPTVALALVVSGAQTLAAGASAGGKADRVKTVFENARKSYFAAQTNATLAWEFGRVCFERAEFATNNTERTVIAEQGIAACKRAVKLQPASAAAHHYLGLNLGQLARVKRFSALWLVDEMEAAFNVARGLDAKVDFAGPDRCLGLLYLEAPGWPVSVGSRTKAAQHLRRAVELAPNFPENRLNLLNAYLHWNNHEAALAELKALEETWPAARTNFTGEAWTSEWADWEKRLKRAKTKLDDTPKNQTSPRQKE